MQHFDLLFLWRNEYNKYITVGLRPPLFICHPFRVECIDTLNDYIVSHYNNLVRHRHCERGTTEAISQYEAVKPEVSFEGCVSHAMKSTAIVATDRFVPRDDDDYGMCMMQSKCIIG